MQQLKVELEGAELVEEEAMGGPEVAE